MNILHPVYVSESATCNCSPNWGYCVLSDRTIHDKEFGRVPGMQPINISYNNYYLNFVHTLLLPCRDKTQLLISLLLSYCDILSFILGTEDAKGNHSTGLTLKASYSEERGAHINYHAVEEAQY